MPQLEQLQFFFSQAFWLALMFFFIYAFVSCFFIPRIGSIVEMRHEKIKTDLSLAEKLAKEQGEITSKIESILEKARSKSSEVKLAATKNAENFTNESINRACKKDISG
jgi:F-type H+-transporting ATPase subunit b